MDLINQVWRSLVMAGLPVVGLSIGVPSDKATWRVDFADTATANDRQRAADLIAAFDRNDPAVIALDQDALASVEIDADKALSALARVTYKYLPAGKPATLTAFAQEIKTVYKGLL